MNYLKNITISMFAVMMLSASSCQGDQKLDTYSADTITEITADTQDDGSLVLSVMPLMETAHFLAGAKVTETDDTTELQLVRCGLSATCDVDVEATVTPGSSDPYEIKLPSAKKAVVVIYDDGSRKTVFEPKD